MTEAEAVGYVGALHTVVDQLVAPLEAQHADRLQCARGCSGCCKDGLATLPIEALRIQALHADVLTEAPGPAGGCAFLDTEGACRIYADRPYICRTQGLPLRWAEEEDGELFEARDICPLNAEGTPLDQLEAEAMWTLGPIERRLAAAQETFGGSSQRVPLRSLFQAQS